MFAHQGLGVTDITFDNANPTNYRHAKQRMTFNKLIPLFLSKSVTEVAYWNATTIKWSKKANSISWNGNLSIKKDAGAN